jgi:hypothetical protein
MPATRRRANIEPDTVAAAPTPPKRSRTAAAKPAPKATSKPPLTTTADATQQTEPAGKWPVRNSHDMLERILTGVAMLDNAHVLRVAAVLRPRVDAIVAVDAAQKLLCSGSRHLALWLESSRCRVDRRRDGVEFSVDGLVVRLGDNSVTTTTHDNEWRVELDQVEAEWDDAHMGSGADVATARRPVAPVARMGCMAAGVDPDREWTLRTWTDQDWALFATPARRLDAVRSRACACWVLNNE